MKSTGILFNGEMVRAIREGRKTQTRMIIKPQPRVIHAIHNDASIETNLLFRRGDQRIHCPYGKPGDLLWVRETFTLTQYKLPVYRADARDKDGKLWPSVHHDPDGVLWTPSIHMPRWASRITLEIVSVRAQRLQDISDFDAYAEGAQSMAGTITGPYCMSYIEGYRSLWESINGPGSWERNDFVFAVEFKEVKP